MSQNGRQPLADLNSASQGPINHVSIKSDPDEPNPCHQKSTARRSSILRPPLELERPTGSQGGENRRASRRVSFAFTLQAQHIYADGTVLINDELMKRDESLRSSVSNNHSDSPDNSEASDSGHGAAINNMNTSFFSRDQLSLDSAESQEISMDLTNINTNPIQDVDSANTDKISSDQQNRDGLTQLFGSQDPNGAMNETSPVISSQSPPPVDENMESQGPLANQAEEMDITTHIDGVIHESDTAILQESNEGLPGPNSRQNSVATEFFNDDNMDMTNLSLSFNASEVSALIAVNSESNDDDTLTDPKQSEVTHFTDEEPMLDVINADVDVPANISSADSHNESISEKSTDHSTQASTSCIMQSSPLKRSNKQPTPSFSPLDQSVNDAPEVHAKQPITNTSSPHGTAHCESGDESLVSPRITTGDPLLCQTHTIDHTLWFKENNLQVPVQDFIDNSQSSDFSAIESEPDSFAQMDLSSECSPTRDLESALMHPTCHEWTIMMESSFGKGSSCKKNMNNSLWIIADELEHELENAPTYEVRESNCMEILARLDLLTAVRRFTSDSNYDTKMLEVVDANNDKVILQIFKHSLELEINFGDLLDIPLCLYPVKVLDSINIKLLSVDQWTNFYRSDREIEMVKLVQLLLRDHLEVIKRSLLLKYSNTDNVDQLFEEILTILQSAITLVVELTVVHRSYESCAVSTTGRALFGVKLHSYHSRTPIFITFELGINGISTPQVRFNPKKRKDIWEKHAAELPNHIRKAFASYSGPFKLGNCIQAALQFKNNMDLALFC